MSKVGTLLSIMFDPRFYSFLVRKGLRWLRGLLGEYAGLRHGEIVLGKHAYVHPKVLLQAGPGECIKIGDYTSVNGNTILMGDVCIERYCLLSFNVYISSGEHYAYLFPPWIIRNQDEFVAVDASLRDKHSHAVHIEEDVWIGWGVFIRKGVYVGRGAILGAGAVVTNDVPPYTVHVGAPNRELTKRLAFQPPRRIDAADESHWPYFYAGFLLRPEHLAASRPSGALLATETTRVMLAGGRFQGVRLRGFLPPGTAKLPLAVSCNGACLGEVVLEAERFDYSLAAVNSSQEALPVCSRSSVLQGYNEVEFQVRGAESDKGRRGRLRPGRASYSLCSVELL